MNATKIKLFINYSEKDGIKLQKPAQKDGINSQKLAQKNGINPQK